MAVRALSGLFLSGVLTLAAAAGQPAGSGRIERSVAPAAEAVTVYVVTGVVAPDVLNMREAPGVKSPVVERLLPGAQVTRVGDEQQQLGEAVWWRVSSEGVQGWVNQRYLSMLNTANSGGLSCLGTEPNWTLVLDAAGTASYQAMGEAAVSYQGKPLSGLTTERAWALTLQPLNGGSVMSLQLQRAQCGDGMSDRVYDYLLDVTGSPDGALSGCCSLQ